MRTWLPALVLVGATLVTAGCGGSSSKGWSSNTLSQAELTTKADAICMRLTTELSASAAVGTANNMQNVASVVPRHVALERAALAELSKLTPPASVANDWQQIVASRQTLIEDLIKIGAYAKVKNTQGISSVLVSARSVSQKMLASVNRVGLKDCSQVG